MTCTAHMSAIELHLGLIRWENQNPSAFSMQVFNLTKIGAVEAFIHERNVLKALQTFIVLPKLVVFSSKCDSATAASLVTEAVVSQVTRGTFAVLVMCKGGIPLCVLLASQNICYIL